MKDCRVGVPQSPCDLCFQAKDIFVNSVSLKQVRLHACHSVLCPVSCSVLRLQHAVWYVARDQALTGARRSHPNKLA